MDQPTKLAPSPVSSEKQQPALPHRASETLLAESRFHWMIFSDAFMATLKFGFLLGALAFFPFMYFAKKSSHIAYAELTLFFVIAAYQGYMYFLAYRCSQLDVTDKRILKPSGGGPLSGQTLTDMPYSQIEGVVVQQSFVGRLLGYGSLTINGTGGRSIAIHCIQQPWNLYETIQKKIHP